MALLLAHGLFWKACTQKQIFSVLRRSKSKRTFFSVSITPQISYRGSDARRVYDIRSRRPWAIERRRFTYARRARAQTTADADSRLRVHCNLSTHVPSRACDCVATRTDVERQKRGTTHARSVQRFPGYTLSCELRVKQSPSGIARARRRVRARVGRHAATQNGVWLNAGHFSGH